jgi:hypothetical protein
MTKRAVRVALLVLFVAGAAAGAYHVVHLESQAATEQAAARSFDEGTAAAALGLVELRGAQQAYVAAGQSEDFWIPRVAGATESLRRQLETLSGRASAAAAAAGLQTTLGAVDGFEQMDRRARDHTQSGQRLLASDLIFTDGLELIQTAARHLHAAHAAERAARDTAHAALRQEQAYVVGGVMAAALLVMLLLVPTGARPKGPAEDVRLVPAGGPTPAPAEVDPVAAALDARAADWTPAAPVTADTNLAQAARLCTDFGRVVDSAELPSLIERAARLFEAPGIILWIGEPGGNELRPAVAHGYPESAMARMGPIHRDEDNATAAAFRTGELQVVNAGGGSNGAIVAPLVTSAGCVGAIAAEVPPGRDRDEGLQALACIIAAQLATLLPPVPVEGVASRTARS